MIHYRKSGDREFFRVDDERSVVTRVLNKLHLSRIEKYRGDLMADDVLQDELNKPSTEEEFTSAYKEALERITSGKI